MSAHSPGPWELRQAVNGCGDCGIIAPGRSRAFDRVVIAEVFASIDFEGERSPEAPANARLIAAAPRMFAVIEKGAAAGDAECIAIMEAVNGRV